MINYLVRIYRKTGTSRRTVVGEVEEVGIVGKKAFSNLDELWSILNLPKSTTAKTMKRNKPDRLNKLNKP